PTRRRARGPWPIGDSHDSQTATRARSRRKEGPNGNASARLSWSRPQCRSSSSKEPWAARSLGWCLAGQSGEKTWRRAVQSDTETTVRCGLRAENCRLARCHRPGEDSRGARGCLGWLVVLLVAIQGLASSSTTIGADNLQLAPVLSFTDDSGSAFPIRGDGLDDAESRPGRATVIFFGTSHCWNTNR